MELEVIRFSNGTDSTNGILINKTNNKFLAYTLEDEYRDEKNMARQEYLKELTSWVYARLAATMRNIRNVLVIFTLVCFMFSMFLILSIFLFIEVILTNTRRAVYSSETPKKIIKSRRTVL